VDPKKVEAYWEENAANWTKLARLGYNKCRDLVNSPAFFKILPEISGLTGLDLGCGKGYNTRIAAKKGAKMDAIDIAPTFISFAENQEKEKMFKIPRFDRTLADWLNLLIEKRFALEEFNEPCMNDEILNKFPNEYDCRIISYFLIIRCRK
jgi:2-polyprenyl-3-methyl-5-hydroxy-6-metoxy-1,4-benzoquinol methylase